MALRARKHFSGFRETGPRVSLTHSKGRDRREKLNSASFPGAFWDRGLDAKRVLTWVSPGRNIITRRQEKAKDWMVARLCSVLRPLVQATRLCCLGRSALGELCVTRCVFRSKLVLCLITQLFAVYKWAMMPTYTNQSNSQFLFRHSRTLFWRLFNLSLALVWTRRNGTTEKGCLWASNVCAPWISDQVLLKDCGDDGEVLDSAKAARWVFPTKVFS